MFFIYPYSPFSSSAKRLAEELGGKRIKHVGSKFKDRGHKIINWGASRIDNLQVLNSFNLANLPENVALASNKLLTFETLRGNVPVPEYTTCRIFAQAWDSDVVVRHILTGHSGEGLEIVPKGSPLPDAPLYVKYEKKTREFRVHVGRRGFIDFQEKKRRLDVPDNEVNWQVRNFKHGFTYAREGALHPEALSFAVKSVAHKALSVLGLDFAAVDVIYHPDLHTPLVLEVNTAPGLEGTTLERYVSYFKTLDWRTHNGLQVFKEEEVR